jgi:WD40 repeat protein
MMIWNDKLVCGLEAPWFDLRDLNTGQSLNTLSVHECGAFGIMIWNDKFVSISGDETVRIWDPNTQLYFWKQVDKDLRYRGCMTAISDSKFATSSNQTINIWDFSSPRLNHSEVDLKPSKKRSLDDDEHASPPQKKRS